MSFPPADIGLLAWIGLVPLFYALGFSTRPWQGGLVGLVYGAVFFALLMQYISMFGLLPWVALALFQGLFFAIFGWTAVYVRRVSSVIISVSAMAAAWVLVEYLRSHIGPLSFSFGNLAYSQYALPAILQVASLLGGGAVTFLIVLSNAILAQMLLPPSRPASSPQIGRPVMMVRAVAVGYGLIGITYLGGVVAVSVGYSARPGDHPVRVAVVQGNVDLGTPVTAEDAERCRQIYATLTLGLPNNLDLAVWPETALPIVLNRDPVYLSTVEQLAQQREAFLLIGSLEESDSGELYNTAYLLNPDGEVVERYRKIDLVMFGEYVPWRERLKFLSRYPIRRFDFIPGRQRELMRVNDTPFGVLICFEAIFSQPTRELCRKGAQFLVFVTSDVWAVRTPEVLQHSYTAPLRAVEARKYVVRAATMGQSALISPYGEVIRAIPPGATGTTGGEVYPRSGLSVYHRFGDLPLMVICLLVWIIAMFNRPLAPVQH